MKGKLRWSLALATTAAPVDSGDSGSGDAPATTAAPDDDGHLEPVTDIMDGTP